MKPDQVFHNNPDYQHMAWMQDGLAFTCEGHQQSITFISPAFDRQKQPDRRFPLVVFLQGSGWTSPNRFAQLPQLCKYAQHGIAVASITHRDATQGFPFPAYLKDAKAAIRFLRSQADALAIDPQRVAFMGTSSGGNTALLVGLTGDDPRYKTEDYTEYSDAVSAVVDCFGPTDLIDFEGSRLSDLYKNRPDISLEFLQTLAQREDAGVLPLMLSLIGQQDVLEVLTAMSPVYQVDKDKATPPFLILQGDADDVVPKSQSDKMHQRLLELDKDSTYAVIRNAEHEGTFWSEKVHACIFDFLKKHLQS